MARRLLLALAALTAVLSPSPSQAGPSAKAVLSEGEACQRPSPEGSCSPMIAGKELGAGNELVAGAGGATVKLGDGSVVDLDAGSVMKLGAMMAVPIGPGDPVKAQYVLLSSGKLRARANNAGPKPKVAVLVKGPHMAQAIITGRGIARVKGEQMGVANLAGKMLATSSKDWGEVPALKARTLSRDEGKPQLRDLMPAPTLLPSRQVVTSLSGASEGLEAAWQPVAGATMYEIAVRKAGEERETRTQVKGDVRSAAIGKLAAGEYEARVKAYDSDEIDGAESAPLPLTVVNVEVPPGGWAVGNGAVQLADGQQIALSPVDGLEAAYDVATDFSPAPKSLVMRGGNTRLLRLRHKGGTVETKLRVEPRTLAADVEIGPKRARWPQDSVTITVKLVNRSGGAVPPNVKLVPEVKVGLAPIAVDWKEEGNALMRAVVPPQPGSGPTVVRVEVKDQHGLFLGRNFLEIETASPAPSKK